MMPSHSTYETWNSTSLTFTDNLSIALTIAACTVYGLEMVNSYRNIWKINLKRRQLFQLHVIVSYSVLNFNMRKHFKIHTFL